ncbi:MAG: DUF4136 domain-containing protein [Chlorobi bacterium]|nr:DUF4136 domain-containing protein [Chlorobiota bacterium]
MKTDFKRNGKIWRKYLPVLFLFALMLSFTSCYTDYGLTTADYDVVITQYDKNTDFGVFKTFSLVDSVFHITGDTTESDSDLLTRKYDKLILSTIRENMINYGYTEIKDPSDQNEPAVVIVVRALGTQIDQYYYGGYYPGWGYPGWGYPGWGWGGYYPGYVGKSTYYVGTLFIDYFDVAASENDLDGKLVAPWYATINGLLQSGQSESRLTGTVNQAFEQSPYLKVK